MTSQILLFPRLVLHKKGVCGQGLAGTEIFAIGSDPIGSNFVLRKGEINAAIAHHSAQVIFERILDAGVPHALGIRLWPKISNIVRTAEFGADQVIYFVGPRFGRWHPVVVEDLIGKMKRDGAVVAVDLNGAHLLPRNKADRSRGKSGIGQRSRFLVRRDHSEDCDDGNG